MTQDDKHIAEQSTENSQLGTADQAGEKQPVSVKLHASDSANKFGEIKKNLAHVSTTLQVETTTLAANALDLVKHPSHYAELGSNLAAGMAGESLGEVLGASLGTIAGPEGTTIGAEVGAIACEVFAARQGSKIAKKLLHQTETEHPLKEDFQIESSERVGGHAGKTIGGMIGEALFDDAGSEIGKTVGDKIGNLIGMLTFEHVEKLHINRNEDVGMKNKIRTIVNYVLIGVIGFLPIALIFQIIIYVEGFLKDFVLLVHGKYENPLVTMALFVSAIALLYYFGKQIKHDKANLLYYLEGLVQRIPIIGTIYRVSHKLLQLFLTTEESQVREVVYVEYPKDGMWVPAYVTNRIDDCYILYVPTSPNPTSGFTVMVHKSKIIKSNMNIEEVSSFVISVGVDYAKPEDVKSLYK